MAIQGGYVTKIYRYTEIVDIHDDFVVKDVQEYIDDGYIVMIYRFTESVDIHEEYTIIELQEYRSWISKMDILS